MQKDWKTEFRKYIDEALGLGVFMFSAGFFDALIEYPGLPLRHRISSALATRFLVGLSMGGTALFIFTSRFGKRSGAYINPTITIIRYRLGDINRMDGIFYILFQFLGGSLGMWLVVLLFPVWMRDPSINYIVTVPGKAVTLYITFESPYSGMSMNLARTFCICDHCRSMDCFLVVLYGSAMRHVVWGVTIPSY